MKSKVFLLLLLDDGRIRILIREAKKLPDLEHGKNLFFFVK
jgi:hypothetical protein